MAKPRKKKKKEREFILPHKLEELRSLQGMTTSEIRAILDKMPSQATKMSREQVLFVIKAAEEIAKVDRARAQDILKRRGLPPLRDRKELKSKKKRPEE